jgi:Flp pilus assembly protein TadD
MGERAAASDWAGVRAVLEQVRATTAVTAGDTSPASATDLELALTLAKWDARSALASGQPAHAAVAFDGLDARIDDEARALRAVAWLRSGDAALAVDAYRDLLARSPRDARLWLGLALALESSAGTPDATRFAYLQTLELAQDEAVRAVARARLAPPQA